MAFGANREDQVGRIALAVNHAINGHAQCIAGVAILVLVAEHFGIELLPRAVGLAGQAANGNVLITGTAATEHIRANGGDARREPAPTTATTWAADSPFRQSGHMVAVDERTNMLIDPSLEQYAGYGFPDTVIMTRIDPQADVWTVLFEDGGFIEYLPTADAGGWKSEYEAARIAAASMAREIAEHLKRGESPNAHRVTLDFDGAIIR
ncbi:hypothetical protein OB08_06285 [Microbacterium sp. HJ5]